MDVGTCNSKENFQTVRTTLIDLFASRRSKQVSKYFTPDQHDLRALGTDALYQNWNYKKALLYAFPPPMLIPLVLARVHEFRVSVILGTPWWSRAPGIPELMSLSVFLPFRIPEGRSIRDITYNTELSLLMVAWNISTAPSRRQGCRIKWPAS